MNELLGEENFIATVIWQKVYSPKNSAKHFSEDHDYLVVYAKNSEIWMPKLLPRTEEMEARYGNPDNEPRGPWKPGDLSARNYYGEGTYPIVCPSGRRIDGPPAGRYWVVSESKFHELDADKRIWWGADGNNVPAIKRFLSEVKDGRVPQTLWTYQEVGHTQEGKKELIASVSFPNSDTVFETPKPTRLIRRILQLATSPSSEDVVLDFFAGTGTTMEAVFAQNSEDGGKRRCIMVQLPEPIHGSNAAAIRTIADITLKRVSAASQRIKTENPILMGDLGFRVFKLDSTNIVDWDPDRELGLDLCVPIATQKVEGSAKQVHDLHSVGAGSLLVCLSKSIPQVDVEPLALALVAWHQELKPAGDTTVVFRDSAFADDVAKTNITAILQQHGIETVRSL
jgi:adenine-specific DNA-methyltransferase